MDNKTFYADLKRQIIAWAETVPDIRAMIMVGSLARKVKPGDEYADLDIEAYVTKDSLDKPDFIQWVRDYAPVWMVVDDHHEDMKSWLVLYQGGIKFDFSIEATDELQRLVDEQKLFDSMMRGYEILLDKDDVAAKLPPPDYDNPPAYRPPNEAEFVQRVENFYYGAVYVAKQIKRRNLWKVKWADQYQQTFMLQMLEWHAHATSKSAIDTYYRGDYMRDWVSDETWHAIHNIFSHFEVSDSKQALLASLALYVRLTDEVAAHLNYTYPKPMVNEVTAYIKQLLADV